MLYFDIAGFSSKLMKYVKFNRIEKELTLPQVPHANTTSAMLLYWECIILNSLKHL